MYNKPREAKRLFFDVIPRHVDDYLAFLERFPGQDAKTQARQPGLAHPRRQPAGARARRRQRPGAATTISFAMLLNLVAVANSEDPAVLWGFIRRYAPGVSPETHPRLDRARRPRGALFPRLRAAGQGLSAAPTDVERAALAELAEALQRP